MSGDVERDTAALVGRQVWVALYTHAHGENVTVHATPEGAWAALADAARDGWDELRGNGADLPPEPPEGDEEAAGAYFDMCSDEDGAVDTYEIQA